MSRTLDEIVDSAIEDLENWVKENPNGDPYDSEISEIADSSVPVYYSEILELASDNHHLALDTPEIGPAFDGSSTPINIIAANIYEHVYNALCQRWNEIEREMDEED